MTETLDDATYEVAALADSRTSARRQVDIHLRRIADRKAVGAWAWVDPDHARRQADACDAAGRPGSLHGLAVGVKDVIATRDMPTRYNSRLYDDADPTGDAACVALLRRAGAVILGKTTTVELASIGSPPGTTNPHDPRRTPGGSSSGSAAAVSDGQAPLALGTQTGGSIIRPASFCGTWAFKPTWGLVPTDGVKPFAPSLDTVGWFARSARDLALLLPVLAGRSTPDAKDFRLAGSRIAVWRTAGWCRAEEATRRALDTAVGLLTTAGAGVEVVEFPFPDLAAMHRVVMFREGQRSFEREYRLDPGKLDPRIAEMVAHGGGYSDHVLRQAHDGAGRARAAFDALAGAFDAVLAPSTIGEAPLGLASTGDLLFNGLLTLLHVPCANLPLFRAANGMPVGLTLTGPRFADAKVLSVAAAISMAAGRAA